MALWNWASRSKPTQSRLASQASEIVRSLGEHYIAAGQLPKIKLNPVIHSCFGLFWVIPAPLLPLLPRSTKKLQSDVALANRLALELATSTALAFFHMPAVLPRHGKRSKYSKSVSLLT